jgi:hypothetical protein
VFITRLGFSLVPLCPTLLYLIAFMRSTKQRLLKDFGQIVTHLQSLFRSRQSLTENEQLYIENRLMILQLEYSLWAKRPIKIALPEKKLPPLDSLTPSPLDQDHSQADA